MWRWVGGEFGELWGPLHLAPGTEWITESPRVVFKGLIGLGAATTTPVLLFHFTSPCVLENTYNAKRGGRQFSVLMSENIGTMIDSSDKAVAEEAR